MRGQLADRKAGDDQLAALAVDVAETRRRGDDAFQTAVDHVDHRTRPCIIVSILIELINMSARTHRGSAPTRPHAAWRQPRDALCLRQPRLRPLAGRRRARHASAAIRATTSSGCAGGPRSAAIPDKAAARALQWGLPSSSRRSRCIDGQRLYYRGHDAVALARSRSLAEVASLIWSGTFDGGVLAGSSAR